MDELSRRRKLRAAPMPEVPVEGDLDVIKEDLAVIHGMVTEVRAEAADYRNHGAEQVREALTGVDEAVGKARATVEDVT